MSYRTVCLRDARSSAPSARPKHQEDMRARSRFVRTGVRKVINELREAAEHIKGLKFIHFWDEIFPDDRAWIDDFAAQYQISHRLAFRDMGPSPQDKQIRNIETCRCRPVQSGNGDTERIAARQERDIPPPRDAGKILEASAVLAGCRVRRSRLISCFAILSKLKRT